MLRPTRTLLLVLLASACADANPLSPHELSVLASAEARWKSRPFANYTYEIRQSCFCPPEVNQWTRVTVRDGHVVAADRVPPDSLYPPTTLQYWQPIDSLFARLRRNASDSSIGGVYSDIVVEYDPVLGYPTRIEWREKPTVADAGAVYTLRNVMPLN